MIYNEEELKNQIRTNVIIHVELIKKAFIENNIFKNKKEVEDELVVNDLNGDIF